MTHIYEGGLEPAQFLVENIGLLSKGRALDVAMGSGRNTIYLTEMGFEVEGVDISPKKVNDALESVGKASITIRAQIADLESNYDSSLILQIKDGLRKGGDLPPYHGAIAIRVLPAFSTYSLGLRSRSEPCGRPSL